MATLGGILYGLGAITSLVCAIMVIIKVFKVEGAGLGILSIFCGIYTFIWGWMKATQHGLKKVMILWTVSFLAVFAGLGLMALGAANDPELQKAFKAAQEQQMQQMQQQSIPAPQAP